MSTWDDIAVIRKRHPIHEIARKLEVPRQVVVDWLNSSVQVPSWAAQALSGWASEISRLGGSPPAPKSSPAAKPVAATATPEPTETRRTAVGVSAYRKALDNYERASRILDRVMSSNESVYPRELAPLIAACNSALSALGRLELTSVKFMSDQRWLDTVAKLEEVLRDYPDPAAKLRDYFAGLEASTQTELDEALE